MFKRLFAPLLVLTLAVSIFSWVNLNSDQLATTGEADQNYFIKPIPRQNLVVVEPNYGRFFHPDSAVQADKSGEILYNSLSEIEQDYQIQETKMISFDRKGKEIPNLYVKVNKSNNN